MGDGSKLVCAVVLHVIRHGTREKSQSLGTTQVHTFYNSGVLLEISTRLGESVVPE